MILPSGNATTPPLVTLNSYWLLSPGLGFLLYSLLVVIFPLSNVLTKPTPKSEIETPPPPPPDALITPSVMVTVVPSTLTNPNTELLAVGILLVVYVASTEPVIL